MHGATKTPRLNPNERQTKMKLSKNALKEILTKCEKRFPRQIGASIDTGDSWAKFCAKNPIEFRGNINGAQYIIRVANDA